MTGEGLGDAVEFVLHAAAVPTMVGISLVWLGRHLFMLWMLMELQLLPEKPTMVPSACLDSTSCPRVQYVAAHMCTDTLCCLYPYTRSPVLHAYVCT